MTVKTRSSGQPQAQRAPEAAHLLQLYSQMLLIRRSEERLSTMFADGEVPGFIHLSIGQEAVSVGVMSALNAEDTIASTHRGHGHAIAKGLPLEGFFLELLARDEGLCRGRGGSMHVADMSVGMLGANGIVGAGLPIALGSAMAHQQLGRKAVAVAFFGDGALAEGVVHECFNLASLWKLPLLYVCENNGWSEFLPSSKQIAFKLGELAAAFHLSHVAVDGNDVAAVAAAAEKIVTGVRAGEPAVLDCVTTRVRGHFEGDAQKYRNPDEVAKLAERDPLRLTAMQLQDMGVAEAELANAAESIERRVEAAVNAARRGRDPDFEAARADVYSRVEGNHG
ncbi:thiamine pyrophosphate-dependent dehydrogenase E1 component subunit alpha [uncultured Bradyrhizobium sp.]|uniref:thiamine pyrophosphate-dependent dehydrogenase E1 component subunit alpha n=1 Tax=uncultured Bradyrhizobium sp. TaxID=199684 RepID=UPI00260600DB|nr:thiamine pyrophosphate-dependent dehydrogenase E1 component subunit alpha [uncultured Bradyrhizobium sp.]